MNKTALKYAVGNVSGLALTIVAVSVGIHFAPVFTMGLMAALCLSYFGYSIYRAKVDQMEMEKSFEELNKMRAHQQKSLHELFNAAVQNRQEILDYAAQSKETSR